MNGAQPLRSCSCSLAYASQSLGKGRSGPFEASVSQRSGNRTAVVGPLVLLSAWESSLFTERLAVPVGDSFCPLPKDLQIDKVHFRAVMLTLPCEQAGGIGAPRL